MSRSPQPLSRRSLLATAAPLVLSTCEVSRPTAGVLGRLEALSERVERLLFSPRRLAKDPGEGALTPEGQFPAYKIGSDYPKVPEGFRLRVGGRVARPMELTLDELQRLPRVDVRYRHHCVEGWSAVAGWHGVRLSDVAQLAGAHARAAYVQFLSFETDDHGVHYSSSWDRGSALHPQTLLAYGRNGLPLSRLYGGPVRLYSAVKLGYKMVKWVDEVRFCERRAGGYWEDQGYEWWAGV